MYCNEKYVTIYIYIYILQLHKFFRILHNTFFSFFSKFRRLSSEHPVHLAQLFRFRNAVTTKWREMIIYKGRSESRRRLKHCERALTRRVSTTIAI